MKITMTLVDKKESLFNGKPAIRLTFIDKVISNTLEKTDGIHQSKLCLYRPLTDTEFSGYRAGDKVQIEIGVGL